MKLALALFGGLSVYFIWQIQRLRDENAINIMLIDQILDILIATTNGEQVKVWKDENGVIHTSLDKGEKQE